MNDIKFIPGTGNAYSCDKEGNIYSHYLLGNHKISPEPQRKLSIYQGGTSSYDLVSFSLDGNTSNQLVHRLIAKTWIENPNNYPEVDHIDNNIHNNCAINLQWVNRQMNIDKQNCDKEALNGVRSHTKLYDSLNQLIGDFPSIASACKYASEYFGCSKTGMQKYHKSNGYYIVADNEEKRDYISKRMKEKWLLYDKNNNFIGEFPSKREAGKYIKENIRDISIKRFSDKGKAYGYYVIEKSVETK